MSVAVLCFVVVGSLVRSAHAQDSGYRLPQFQEFLVLAPRTVRPNQVYEVHVTLSHRYYHQPIVLNAVLSRDGIEYASGHVTFTQTGTKVIQLKVPVSVRPGKHKLTVEGLVETASIRPQVYANGSNVGSYAYYQPVFHNETELVFSAKWVSLFFMMDRPEYTTPCSVLFRIIGVYPDLKPASGSMTIYIRDSKGNFVRRWIQKYFNFGVYEGKFDIDYPVNVGTWAIVVDAFGHRYEHNFNVRFWWQRSVEVNLSVPILAYDTDWGVTGLIFGDHVSGAPGYGNANVSVKIMNADGTTEPGELTQELGYVGRHHYQLLR